MCCCNILDASVSRDAFTGQRVIPHWGAFKKNSSEFLFFFFLLCQWISSICAAPKDLDSNDSDGTGPTRIKGEKKENRFPHRIEKVDIGRRNKGKVLPVRVTSSSMSIQKPFYSSV